MIPCRLLPHRESHHGEFEHGGRNRRLGNWWVHHSGTLRHRSEHVALIDVVVGEPFEQ